MKPEFITDLLPDIDKSVLEKIMDEHGRDMETQKNAITTLTTERDGLRAQLDTATTEIKSYQDLDIDGIKAKAIEWEGKHKTDTEALQKQLDDERYGHVVEKATHDIAFTSEGARKSFLADLTAKKLPLQDGKLLGMDDFVKSYQTSDPGAFQVDDDKTPVATKGGTSGGTLFGAGSALRAAFGLNETEMKKE